MKSFEDWKSPELQRLFQIKRLDSLPELAVWLAAAKTPTPEEQAELAKLQTNLRQKAEYWNEAELQYSFISPLVGLVDFVKDEFSTFNQRMLTAERPDRTGKMVALRGKVETLVATGIDEPEQPFFFLHEYKQERRKTNEPPGQLLSAMLAAQTLNKKQYPLYGCYVVGRLWFFVVLTGPAYSVSLAFDATKSEDLSQIYAMLHHVKATIYQYLAQFPMEEM